MAKTIVFSDTHLSNRFNKKKFEFLEKIIHSADQVIINGDFWDAYITSFDKFVKSDWNKLFPLLKNKNTTYIYGNHDKDEWSDERTNLFSDNQVNKHTLQIGDKDYYIEHGHSIWKGLNDEFPFIPRWKLIGMLPRVWYGIGYKVQGDKFQERFKETNDGMLDWTSQNGTAHMHIFGHSHLPEYLPEAKFINSGFIMYGHGSYIEIDDNKIELVRQTY